MDVFMKCIMKYEDSRIYTKLEFIHLGFKVCSFIFETL